MIFKKLLLIYSTLYSLSSYANMQEVRAFFSDPDVEGIYIDEEKIASLDKTYFDFLKEESVRKTIKSDEDFFYDLNGELSVVCQMADDFFDTDPTDQTLSPLLRNCHQFLDVFSSVEDYLNKQEGVEPMTNIEALNALSGLSGIAEIDPNDPHNVFNQIHNPEIMTEYIVENDPNKEYKDPGAELTRIKGETFLWDSRNFVVNTPRPSQHNKGDFSTPLELTFDLVNSIDFVCKGTVNIQKDLQIDEKLLGQNVSYLEQELTNEDLSYEQRVEIYCALYGFFEETESDKLFTFLFLNRPKDRDEKIVCFPEEE